MVESACTQRCRSLPSHDMERPGLPIGAITQPENTLEFEGLSHGSYGPVALATSPKTGNPTGLARPVAPGLFSCRWGRSAPGSEHAERCHGEDHEGNDAQHRRPDHADHRHLVNL